MVIFLDLDPEIAAARAGYGAERYERVEFQKAVRENFKKIQDPTWAVVDASKSIDEMTDSLRRIIDEFLSKPIADLSTYKFY